MLAAMPEMNEKISVVLHMGPVLFVRYFKAPVLRTLANIRAEQVSWRAGCRLSCMLHVYCAAMLVPTALLATAGTAHPHILIDHHLSRVLCFALPWVPPLQP